MKKRNYEVLGLKFEIAGLVFLLAAALWQTSVSGWWEEQLPEYHYLIQYESNIDILYGISNLASLYNIKDEEKIKSAIDEIKTKSSLAVSEMASKYAEKERNEKGAASSLSKVAVFLSLFAAFLIIVGKYYIMKSTAALADVAER